MDSILKINDITSETKIKTANENFYIANKSSSFICFIFANKIVFHFDVALSQMT